MDEKQLLIGEKLLRKILAYLDEYDLQLLTFWDDQDSFEKLGKVCDEIMEILK